MSFEKVIANIEERQNNNAELNGDEYIGENGLRHCSVCHTATQCRVTIFGAERIQKCICKCGAERREEMFRKIKSSELEHEFYQVRSLDFDDFRLFRWFNRNEYSISPRLVKEREELLKRLCFPEAEKMQGCTFDTDDGSNEKVTAVAREYVNNFADMYEKGMGLLFFGETGVGKSFISACIANALVDKGKPVRMTNFERISNELWETKEKQSYMDMLNKFDLLVIDDLAAEKSTEYMDGVIFNVIDSRLRAGLPMIVTTNLTRQELLSANNMKKKRIYSRLFECCVPYEVTGDDRRRQQLVENKRAYDELLNSGLK